MLDEREQQIAEPIDAFKLFVNGEPATDKHPVNPPKPPAAPQELTTDVYRDSSGELRLKLGE